MASVYEAFWQQQSYAVVGHTAKKPFPIITYQGLKKLGKKVIAVDPSAATVDGDKTVAGLNALPAPVEAAVIELPKAETAAAVMQAAAAGIKNIWLHQNSDTPEALAVAKDKGLNVLTGHCGVMYTNCTGGHKIHRFFWKLLNRY